MNQPSQSPLHLTNPKMIKNKDSFGYQIEQQVLPAWQPLPTLNSSITLYIILSIFFIVLGGVMLSQDSKAKAKSFRYDHVCQSLSTCEITLNIDFRIQGPVYLYYKLNNFRQNERSYLNSKSNDQLQGKWVDLNTARASCGSKTTNKEMGWTHAVDGTLLDPEQVAFPCGMVSYSMFNDTFSIDSISISQQSISLPNIKNRYKNFDNSKQGIDLHNQHFLVWMRPSPQSQFIKLWGIIKQSLEPGVYKFKIQNNYQVAFSQRWVELSNSSAFGNKNNVLAIGYVVAGVISFIALLMFAAAKGREKIKNTPIFQ